MSNRVIEIDFDKLNEAWQIEVNKMIARQKERDKAFNKFYKLYTIAATLAVITISLLIFVKS